MKRESRLLIAGANVVFFKIASQFILIIISIAKFRIGYAIAHRLALDGAKVVLSSRKQSNVDQALSKMAKDGLNESKVRGIVCHVGKADDRKRLVDFTMSSFGGIDVLVSNAAVSPVAAEILDTPDDAWDKIFDINVKSTWQLTKLVVPKMATRGRGSIVYTSSVGAYKPESLIAAYGVSKTALLGLTKAVSQQCAPMNIRVNCLCPGLVKTKLAAPITENEDILQDQLRNIPMNR